MLKHVRRCPLDHNQLENSFCSEGVWCASCFRKQSMVFTQLLPFLALALYHTLHRFTIGLYLRPPAAYTNLPSPASSQLAGNHTISLYICIYCNIMLKVKQKIIKVPQILKCAFVHCIHMTCSSEEWHINLTVLQHPRSGFDSIS